jgi:ectoine hydroxylase-related dioxygenase (phytanoyl-CoA dioxygenase family)
MSAYEAWNNYKLSDDQVSFFNEFGYLHNIKLLEDDQVNKLKEDLEIVIDPSNPKKELFYEFHSNQSEDPDKTLFHSLGHWRITEGFHDVLWNPRFVVAACQLLGNKAVRFWHDQLFYKPAYHGGVVAWHQDYSYWTRTTPMQHLTCWVGLDDVSKENGCVYYIPKSHKWELLDMPNLTGDMDGLNKFLDKSQQKEFANKVAIEMPKGFGTFHHPLMVHGSYENSSSRPRRAFVLNVFGDGTISNSNDALLEGVNVIEKGEKMGGQFFPLLFDPVNI